jgi:hypothetical protein
VIAGFGSERASAHSKLRCIGPRSASPDNGCVLAAYLADRRAFLRLAQDVGNLAFNPNQPNPVEVPFPPATLGANFFPNPQTTYLETPGFAPSGDFVPRGVFCDRVVFINGGAAACFAAAGVAFHQS